MYTCILLGGLLVSYMFTYCFCLVLGLSPQPPYEPRNLASPELVHAELHTENEAGGGGVGQTKTFHVVGGIRCKWGGG